MVYLIDTNVIVRFLVADNKEQFIKSKELFYKIESSKIKAEILSEVIMETLFVLIKFYKIDKSIVSEKLKDILLFKGIVNSDKYILIEALDTMVNKNIDYVDALICAKSKLQGYEKISFDKDVNRKC